MTIKRAVRVVILGHTGELGGAELSLVRLCAAVQEYHVDVRVVLFADGPLLDQLRSVGVDVQVVPLTADIATADRESAGRFAVGNLWRTARLLPFLVRLTGCLRRARPDVIHSTTLKSTLLGVLPATVLRRPLIWQLHDRIAEDYLPSRLVTLLRGVARVAPRAIVANSRATAETLGRAGQRAVIAYPGFAAEQQVSWSAVRAQPASPVVGLIGRISATKGQRELVRAAPRILEQFPDARFRVVGSPMFKAEEYHRQVRAEAERLDVAEAFTWVGFTEDVAAEIDRLTVLVHASPVPEPFGQVVVEAMVRGVPVVATRAGGVTEILQPEKAERAVVSGGPSDPGHGQLGLLVEPGNVAELAEAVMVTLRDPVAARHRAKRAHASASERFSIIESARMVAGVWQAAAR